MVMSSWSLCVTRRPVRAVLSCWSHAAAAAFFSHYELLASGVVVRLSPAEAVLALFVPLFFTVCVVLMALSSLSTRRPQVKWFLLVPFDGPRSQPLCSSVDNVGEPSGIGTDVATGEQ
jgi:hypothetical protein